MDRFRVIAALLLLLLVPAMTQAQDMSAELNETTLDSNTAYFPGKTVDYVIFAPPGFKMDLDAAAFDGLSAAFIPTSDSFVTAPIMIGMTYYDLEPEGRKPRNFGEIVSSDTTDIRDYFGDSLILRNIDSIYTATDQALLVFYLDDKTRFIPNVMNAYFDGGSEMLIFELSIAEGYKRVDAENIFTTFLSKIKVLTRGKIEP